MILYKVHDYDLVKYYVSLRDKKLNNPNISFAYMMKGLLKDYVSGNNPIAVPIKTYTAEDIPSKIIVRFTLDTRYDKAEIELIENIRDRQINSFLKSLLRRSLDTYGLRCYYADDYAPDSELGMQKAAERRIKKEKKFKAVETEFVQKIKKDKPKPAPKKPTEPKEKYEESESISDESYEEVVDGEDTEENTEGDFDFIKAIGNINF